MTTQSTTPTTAERVLGAKFDAHTVQRVETLAALSGLTVSGFIRLAVEKALEDNSLTYYPLDPATAQLLLAVLPDFTADDLTRNVAALTTTGKFSGLAGVYLLVNQETRQLYVGSSVDITNRLDYHRSLIKKHTHKNAALKRWHISDTVVLVVESSTSTPSLDLREQVLAREQHYMNLLANVPGFELVNQATATANTSAVKTSKRLYNTPSKTVTELDTVFEEEVDADLHEELDADLDEETPEEEADCADDEQADPEYDEQTNYAVISPVPVFVDEFKRCEVKWGTKARTAVEVLRDRVEALTPVLKALNDGSVSALRAAVDSEGFLDVCWAVLGNASTSECRRFGYGFTTEDLSVPALELVQHMTIGLYQP